MKQCAAALVLMALPALLVFASPYSGFALLLLLVVPFLAGGFHRSWKTGLLALVLAFLVLVVWVATVAVHV